MERRGRDGLKLNESREFRFPQTVGDYVLEVEFIDRDDEAQYAGNIVIEERVETRNDEAK